MKNFSKIYVFIFSLVFGFIFNIQNGLAVNTVQLDYSALSGNTAIDLTATNWFAHTFRPTINNVSRLDLNIQTPAFYGLGTSTIFICRGVLDSLSSQASACMAGGTNFTASTSWAGYYGNSNNNYEPITVNFASPVPVVIGNDYFYIVKNEVSNWGNGTGGSPTGKPFIRSATSNASTYHYGFSSTTALRAKVYYESEDTTTTANLSIFNPGQIWPNGTLVEFAGQFLGTSTNLLIYYGVGTSTDKILIKTIPLDSGYGEWQFNQQIPLGDYTVYYYGDTNLILSQPLAVSGVNTMLDYSALGIFGTSTENLVCSPSEWNSTSTYLGLNLTLAKCQFLATFINIGEKIGQSVSWTVKAFVGTIQNVFPLSILIKVGELWLSADSTALPANLAWIDQDNMTIDIPSDWTGSSTMEWVVWGDSAFAGAGADTFFENIRALSTYVIYGTWLWYIMFGMFRRIMDKLSPPKEQENAG